MIPVINKIDLPSADVLRTQEMIESAVGLDATDALPVSAKTGLGVPEVLEAIVTRLPPPTGDAEAPCKLSSSIAGSILTAASSCWPA